MNYRKKALLTMTALLCLNAGIFAQSVSLNLGNVSVKEAMNKVKDTSGYSFVYSKGDIDTGKKVSVKAQQLDEAIRQILDGQNVTYEIKGKNIIIKRITAERQKGNSRKVSGVVKDSQGEPIIGANVVVKGDEIHGVVTDMNGQFSLEVPDNGSFEVSYIGYVAQSVPVKNKSNFIISLSEDTEVLDEVVVVGFGTQKKANLTGAVTAVSGKDISRRPVANASTMLQGQVPGLRVVQGSGQPGAEGVSLKVRGVGTFSGSGASPLVIINGIPGSLENIDPSMIESVSVLKDAASSAIYGARAANGVIMVTTKQGADSDGKVNIGYHGNFAVHTPTKMYDLVTDSPTYMRLFNLAKTNSGLSGLYPDSEIEKYEKSNGDPNYPSFDWLDYMFNPAFVQNHNLSLAGTTNKTTLHYIEVIFNVLRTGWNKDNVGSHIVRNNIISDCEQTGICGSMGGAFCEIYGNHIYNILVKQQFGGAEMAGIKLHGAIDTYIHHNWIHKTGNFGIWLDWMAQGARVSSNLIYDNLTQDLFCEVDHGPYIVDNNFFLSRSSFAENTDGCAFLHNVVAGDIWRRNDGRYTPYHLGHSTEVKGICTIEEGDHRFFNNIFLHSDKKDALFGLADFGEVKRPIVAEDNLFCGKAEPVKGKQQGWVVKEVSPTLRIEETPDGVYLCSDENLSQLLNYRCKPVDSERLGITQLSGLPFENFDGTPFRLTKDYFGNERSSQPVVGPMEKVPAAHRIKVW